MVRPGRIQTMNEARQCACGLWFSDTGRGHTTCKTCRQKPRPKTRRPRRGTRQPVPGSAEWAETRGDDVPSLDQPGDDFDMDN